MPRRLLALIAPPLCAVCGRDCGHGPFCAGCARAIATAPPQPFAVPGIDQALAAAPYDGVARGLIAALKFGRRVALADAAAVAIQSRLDPFVSGTVVPVPADPWRRRIRGFDPAKLIAESLARRLELPLSECLSRRHAARQVGKARVERLASAPSITVRPPVPTRPILVDDVTTTGATLAECARALRHAGSLEILALTFARA